MRILWGRGGCSKNSNVTQIQTNVDFKVVLESMTSFISKILSNFCTKAHFYEWLYNLTALL